MCRQVVKTKFLSVVLSVCMVLSYLSISALANPSVTVGDFDYSNIKITVSADTGDANIYDAIIYVYKSDASVLGDDNLPVYSDYVTLGGGVLENKEILLPLSLEYGTYVVDVCYNGESSPLAGSFTYYSPEELLAIRKADMLAEAKLAAKNSAQSLMDTLFDVDSAGGTKLPENASLFKADIDLDDFNMVENKLEVFNRMIDNGIDKLSDFEAMTELFEKCAKAQSDSENRTTPTSPQSPSKDTSSPGGNKGSVSISPSKGGGSSSGGGVSGGVQAGNTAVNPTPQTSSFADMQNHWADKYAKALCDKKIINGYEDGSFRPENNVTRAEIAKMLVSAFDINGASPVVFGDVKADAWYADFVAKASAAGVITGYNGSFNPDGSLTRQDAALMVYRVLEKTGKLPEDSASFNDDAAIASYASNAVKVLGTIGVLNGDTNGNFNPASYITRAEIAACLCRALDWAQLN